MASDLETLLGKLSAIPSQRDSDTWPRTERFEIVRRLGGGAFGEVYEARDRKHGQTVALKVLKSADAESLYRFKHEFRSVADLSHPNLVKLYELFQEGEHWFLAMELILGLAFDDHLRRAPERTLSAFAQLAAGVEAMHHAGLLHRDIKPTNVLVEATGRVVLLDFGLTWAPVSRGQTMSVGTPAYMAPEQLFGDPCFASDWYSVGVMLYEQIAKKSPFAGGSGTISKVKLQGPIPPIDQPMGPAAHLAGLAAKLISPRVEERPLAPEVLAALHLEESSTNNAIDGFDFIGRADELAALHAALRSSRLGTQAFLIEGPPGIGKSMMAREFCRAAAAQGAAVYEGRCHEAESVPFKGIDSAVDALCNELVHGDPQFADSVLPADARSLCLMFPVLKRLRLLSRVDGSRDMARSPHQAREEAIGAFRELLTNVAAERPTIIFLDDLQWANEDTFTLLLGTLVGGSPRVLFVLTARTKDADEQTPVEDFVHRARALKNLALTRLSLPPLDRASVAMLVDRSARTDLDLEAIWRNSAGHPYLLSRLLHHDVGQEHGNDLVENLRSSFARLSAGARRLLEFVTFSAMPLTQIDGCAVARLDGWKPDLVEELRTQGLIRTAAHADSLVVPYHDRVRESLLADTGAERYVLIHAALAEFLEKSRAPLPHVLATHYRESGQRAAALKWTLEAARAAADSLAFARATKHHEAAVALAEGDEESLALHVQWAKALALVGKQSEAGRVCLAAAESARDLGLTEWSAKLFGAAGEHLLLSGHFDEGIALIESSLSSVGVTMPKDVMVSAAVALNMGAALAVRGIDFEPRSADAIAPSVLRRIDLLISTSQALTQNDIRAAQISCMALDEALRAGEPRRIASALAWFAMSNGQRAPKHPFFAQAIRRAEMLAARVGGSLERGRVATAKGIVAMLGGEMAVAVDSLEKGHQILWNATPAHTADGSMARAALLSAYGYGGVNLPKALLYADEWIAEANSREGLNSMSWMQLMSSWTRLAQDDLVGARERVEQGQKVRRKGDDIFAAMALQGAAAIRLYASPAECWSWFANEASGKFRTIAASIAPLPSCSFALLKGYAAAAAWRGGALGPQHAETVISESIATIEDRRCLVAGILTLEAQLALERRPVAATLFERAAEVWAVTGQRAHALSAALRAAQCRLEPESIAACERRLREFAVVDPSRFATVLAGPAPT